MLNDISSQSSTGPDPSTLHLKCFSCNWSSYGCSDVIKFQRTTGLSTQLQKRLAEHDLHAGGMEKLKKYWKSLSSLSGNITHSGPIANSSSILRKSAQDAKLFDEQTALVKELWVDFEVDACSHDSGTRDFLNSPNRHLVWTSRDLSTISQNACEIPRRTHLRSRMNVRCIKCRHLVVKPTTKPATMEFTISQFAYTYCPSVTHKPTKDPSTFDIHIISAADTSTQNLSAMIPLSESDCSDDVTMTAYSILSSQKIEVAVFSLEQQKLSVDAEAAEHNELTYTLKLRKSATGKSLIPVVITFETLKGAKAQALSILTI